MIKETMALGHHVSGQTIAGDVGFRHKSPSDPEGLVVAMPLADAAVVGMAVKAGRVAIDAMAAQGIEKRSDALAIIAARLADQADDLANLIARETGKLLGDAKGEVMRASRVFAFFAAETLRNVGERFDSTRPGVTVEVIHAPLGVVGLITPWNFPIAIPAWKIAPAIAFGNGVVWKPSEHSSATAARLMKIIGESGLPDGAVNMVLGGRLAGQALAQSSDLDGISFTGSVATGAKVRTSAVANGVRVQAEMGGVNGLIVMADADLENAVECAINGAFFAAGQRCTATSRIILDAPIADRFTEILVARMEKLTVGDPAKTGSVIGPLVSDAQRQKVAAQVAEVIDGGVVPTVGGAGVSDGGAYYPPTLFTDVPHDSVLAHEEIFGPVAATYRVNGFEEAIAALNANRFGLSAGICTRSLKHAEDFKRRARAGMVMINQPTAGVDYHAPFGGTGASSYGSREQGRLAREFYTTVKTSYQLPL